MHCLLHVSVLFCCGVHSPQGIMSMRRSDRQQSWFLSLKFVPETHILVTLVHSYWEHKVPDFGFFFSFFLEPLCLHHSLTPKTFKCIIEWLQNIFIKSEVAVQLWQAERLCSQSSVLQSSLET